MLALALIDPAIDYWSKQIQSRSVGERESSTYKDRVEDLKQLKKDWTAQVAGMFVEIEDLLPLRPRRAADAPRVIQAGETVAHATAQPFDIEPAFGPPEEVL